MSGEEAADLDEILTPERLNRAESSAERRVLLRLLEPIAELLAEPELTEIVVNRPGEVFTEGPQGWMRHERKGLSFSHLMNLATAAAAFTRQDIAADHPIVSTVLPLGERCQIVIPPAVPANTVSLTIRKVAVAAMTLQEFERRSLFADVHPANDGLSADEEALVQLRDAGHWRTFLEGAVASRRNIVISGATGSGKTTLAKGLAALIPDHERILTIEDTAELTILQPNHVRLLYAKDGSGVAKIGPRELLESALRMRPDRILLQELRDGTAFYYLRNVNSGHPGSITTVHADSARLAYEQLTLLVKESAEGRELAREDIRRLLHLTVDVVVQMNRSNGSYRITEIHYDPEAKRRNAF